MEHERMSSDKTDSRDFCHASTSRCEADSILTSNRSQARRGVPQQRSLQSRRKEPKNVLTRIEKITEGPLVVLKKALIEKRRVKVLIRSAVQMRGICTGFVVVFDRHMNMVLSDVDEIYRNPLLLYKQDVERKKVRKKKKKSQKKEFCPVTNETTQALLDYTQPLCTDKEEISALEERLVKSSSQQIDDDNNTCSKLQEAHFSGMNLDGQYDGSSGEDGENPAGAAKAREKGICDKKGDDDSTKHITAKRLDIYRNQNSSGQHSSSRRQFDEETRNKSVTSYKTSKTHSVQDFSTSAAGARSSKKESVLDDSTVVKFRDRSREQSVRTKDPDSLPTFPKDRHYSDEWASRHKSRQLQYISSSHGKPNCRASISSDQSLERYSKTRQHHKPKEYEHYGVLSMRVSQGTNIKHSLLDKNYKSDAADEKAARMKCEVTRWNKSSETGSTTACDEQDPRWKSVRGTVGSHLLTERKGSEGQASDEKCQLTETKDPEKVVQACSQSKQDPTDVTDTTVNQASESTAQDPAKDTLEVLKRHVNKLFIRGDNVVMVILENTL